jgi:hypothetical protein
VSVDGAKFLMTLTTRPLDKPAVTEMILVQNWFEELRRVIPAK